MGQIAGQSGVVKFGPVPAATLQSWHLAARDGEPQTRMLTATAVNVNAFYITQAPLTVVLFLANGRSWRWTGVVLELAGGKVQGIVSGRPECR